jgi:hypothetical protein
VAVFVINEWLWADLSGDNGIGHQRRAVSLIGDLVVCDHRIVIIEGSQFDRKAWNLCKSANALVVRSVVAFVKDIRQNSDRCRILKPEEAADLPDEFAARIKPDDRYLIQAQLAVAGAILVTTDNPLREVLGSIGLSSMSREEFLSTCF